MGRGRILVAMSGGVDSSVAAALLHQEGYDVVGVTMRLWTVERPQAPRLQRNCCSIEESDDARRVCQILGIPHYVLNFEREFRRYVVDYFCAEYRQGRTPNPCVACNQYLKFDFLLRKALALGADALATGHYARVVSDNGGFRLLCARDTQKDQSYALYVLGQHELAHLFLPLGDLEKNDVRHIAAALGLPTAQKPESQEVCFLQGQDYRTFLRGDGGFEPGPIVDSQGRILGTHQGIARYTVGQRRGLGITGDEPRYVIRIDAEYNTIQVGSERELLAQSLIADQIKIVSGQSFPAPTKVTAKIRYRAAEAPALATPLGERLRVEFEEPQRAVTPGQAVVLYREDEVLGGGTIQEVEQ